jgi:hypothetical protein
MTKSVLAVIGAVIAAAIVLEVALRGALGMGHPLLVEKDPAVGYMPVPNQDVHRFFRTIEINSFGMRSDEIPRAKPAGEQRILITGDSVTFGTTYVDQRSIFANLIERDLRAQGKPVRVLNVSMSGWAPANELDYLKSRGTFDADLILVVLNTEDLAQPFSPFNPKISGPTRDPRSAISELVRRYALPLVFRSLQPHDAGSSLIADRNAAAIEPQVLGTLQKMQRLASQSGARFGIVFSPSHDPHVGNNRQVWQSLIDVFRDWARKNGIAVVDMTPRYSAYPAADVYYDGLHLRPLGHQLVAKAVEGKFGSEL